VANPAVWLRDRQVPQRWHKPKCTSSHYQRSLLLFIYNLCNVVPSPELILKYLLQTEIIDLASTGLMHANSTLNSLGKLVKPSRLRGVVFTK
jgi:hypothetical protein